MNFLLDTHVLLWAARQPDKLPEQARAWLEDTDNVLTFSTASLWEITIKSGLGRADLQADPHVLRRGLLDNGYEELSITAASMPWRSQACPPFMKTHSTGC